MSTFMRWWKFNLVGAMGMLVQLGALALFARLAPEHYLVASGTAVELAVLHNFVWHTRYTWSDRPGDSRWTIRLLQFHMSNGAVSLLGNLVLMQLLVHEGRMPLMLANCIAILSCSMANFWLGNHWAFAARA